MWGGHELSLGHIADKQRHGLPHVSVTVQESLSLGCFRGIEN